MTYILYHDNNDYNNNENHVNNNICANIKMYLLNTYIESIYKKK